MELFERMVNETRKAYERKALIKDGYSEKEIFRTEINVFIQCECHNDIQAIDAMDVISWKEALEFLSL